MSKLFDVADRYLKTSDWKTIAVLKFCLLALGIMLGMCVKKEHRKPVLICAGAVFLATCIPLMGKLFQTIKEVNEEE